MSQLTPMKQQYFEIKEQHSDCMLFFRLGDFYEMFGDDAVTASKELDLALTTRDRGKPEEDQTPMCGVPYHSAEVYIARLIAKGYKVAVCEQLEDPAEAKGLVKRDVIRIITPGTVTDSSMLEEGRSNYIAAVWLDGDTGAAAFCDLSTGEFCAASFDSDAETHIGNELGRFTPREVVLCDSAYKCDSLTRFMFRHLKCKSENAPERFETEHCRELLSNQLSPRSPEDFGLDERSIRACGALLGYLLDTQKCDLSNISSVDVFAGGRYMELDWQARRSLELTENQRTGEKRGSLLWVLDRTCTPMGGRLLRSWVERPLLSPVAIRRRHAAVAELLENSVRLGELMRLLGDVGDIQRLAGRAVFGSANGRDLVALGQYCSVLPELQAFLDGCSSQLLREIASMDTLRDISGIVEIALAADPPFSVHEGGLLRSGYVKEVDRLRDVRDNGAKMVSELEARERERTGIKKLKVGYNKVFGYYIDVPNSAGKVKLPEEYMRKQTLVSSERYFTPELKELETELTGAQERICELEYHYFCEVRDKIARQIERIQRTCALVAELDALCSFAETAKRNNYVRPEVDTGSLIDIRDGRHPVVEISQKDTLFVPNDTLLSCSDDRVAVITGPNMAGKSTYMRQTALIVLMAQMGSFVPAKSATIGVVDRVFTRIGASDDLAAGQSTFMVEMTEVASILKNATNRSLIILDEIGRGTSTYDGMAIARAVLEQCADRRRLGAKTMFATHYHELTSLEGTVEGVRNYYITARKQGDSLIFLRRIARGAADDSYGIEVAKLAGVPNKVIDSAKKYLAELESGQKSPTAPAPVESDQLTFGDSAESEVADELRRVSLDSMSPIEAMNLLYKLRRRLDE